MTFSKYLTSLKKSKNGGSYPPENPSSPIRFDAMNSPRLHRPNQGVRDPVGACHDWLAWAMSNSGTPAGPDHARLVVYQCRRKLKRFGWPVSIKGVWGFRYRADQPAGFTVPTWGC